MSNGFNEGKWKYCSNDESLINYLIFLGILDSTSHVEITWGILEYVHTWIKNHPCQIEEIKEIIRLFKSIVLRSLYN